VQGLLKKVSVRPNHDYTEVYPGKMPAKVTIRLQDGNVIEHEVQDYPGLASHPFTWDDSVKKFDRLVAGRVDEGLSGEIKDAVRSLESIQVMDLMTLLSSIKAESAGATLHTKHSPQDDGRFQARNASSTADTTRSI
jgi:2-methylcitrate dehydratase